MATNLQVKIVNAIIEEIRERAQDCGDEFLIEVAGVSYDPSGFTYRDDHSPVLFCGMECPSADIFTFPVSENEFRTLYQDLKGYLLPERILAIGREVLGH